MRMTFRPLAAWPYEPQPARPATYKAPLEATYLDLDRELGYLRATDIVVGLVVDERDVRLDGMLRSGARPSHPGVELSFDAPDKGRLTFHTDRHRGYASSWQDNLRALALGLEALRAVDRYGIAETGQQYAGFLAIPADTSVGRGRALVERHGGVIEALKATHPDHGGDASDFHAVQAYRATR